MKVRFRHMFNNEMVLVVAKADAVDSYEAEDLQIEIYNDSGDLIDETLDKDTFEEIQERAHNELYEKQYEMSFED